MIFHSYVSLPQGTNWVTPTSMATVWPSPAWPSWPACPARLRGSEAACETRLGELVRFQRNHRETICYWNKNRILMGF